MLRGMPRKCLRRNLEIILYILFPSRYLHRTYYISLCFSATLARKIRRGLEITMAKTILEKIKDLEGFHTKEVKKNDCKDFELDDSNFTEYGGTRS